MGPEDQHPWDAQDEEVRQAFVEKDAEIERLKELTKRLARWARIHADQRTVSNQDLLKLIQEAGGGYQ